MLNYRKLSTLFLLQSMLLIPLLGSCSEPAGALSSDEIPVPEGAYDVQRFVLKSESAHQIDFKIRADFPSKQVAQYYVSFFREKGWKSCDSNNEWISFKKRRTEDGIEISVRQLSWYMISTGEKKLLVGTLRYLGDKDPSAKQLERWNGEVQHVTLVLYVLPDDEYDKTLSALPIDCDA